MKISLHCSILIILYILDIYSIVRSRAKICSCKLGVKCWPGELIHSLSLYLDNIATSFLFLERSTRLPIPLRNSDARKPVGYMALTRKKEIDFKFVDLCMNTRLKPFFTPVGSLWIPGMKDQHLIDSTRLPNAEKYVEHLSRNFIQTQICSWLKATLLPYIIQSTIILFWNTKS